MIWSLVAAAIIIAAIAIIIVIRNKRNDASMARDAAQNQIIQNNGANETDQNTANQNSASTGQNNSTPSAMKYSDAVTEFGSRRIQFDSTCKATPNQVTFKSGTQIMLDNRGSAATTVTIGSSSYALPALGYKIATLGSTTAPKTLYINCGKLKNVAQILLQK